MKKCILAITDGIGLNDNAYYNAFAHAKHPNYDELNRSAAFARLATSGLAVGLPEGQIGNSEVGHMCIGSGRVIYQNLVKIDKAIQTGEFFELKTFKELAKKAAQGFRVHVFGLYSDGGVHSSYEHFNAALKGLSQVASGDNVLAHIITDGRDVLPKAAQEFMRAHPVAIAPVSIAGRFWAMDRDNNNDRTEAYMNMLTTKTAANSLEAVFGANEQSDEYLKPARLRDFDFEPGDYAFIINFRSDRARQLAAALKAFGLHVSCMCEYDKKLNLPLVFEPENINDCLAEVISKANLRQLHTAETEKYAHVSFFFNGGKEEPFALEQRVLVPSNGASNYASTPKMSAEGITEAVLNAVNDGVEFIVLNYANGDMVGHTGDFNAAIEAVEEVDKQLGRLMQAAKDNDYALLITSDHGNCEQMKDETTGEILPNHTLFDVGIWLYNHPSKLKDGTLANVAASVLEIMQLSVPSSMQPSLLY